MKQYFIYFKYQYFINCWTTYIGTERPSIEYLGTKKYTAVEELKNSNLFSISGSEDDLIAEQEFLWRRQWVEKEPLISLRQAGESPAWKLI